MGSDNCLIHAAEYRVESCQLGDLSLTALALGYVPGVEVNVLFPRWLHCAEPEGPSLAVRQFGFDDVLLPHSLSHQGEDGLGQRLIRYGYHRL